VQGPELGGGHLGGVGDLVGIGEGVTRQQYGTSGSRRKIRHQPSCRFSQQAPLGMKAWRMRGWSSSHARVLLLSWLDRLSVIT
jgi:hypothetical protein